MIKSMKHSKADAFVLFFLLCYASALFANECQIKIKSFQSSPSPRNNSAGLSTLSDNIFSDKINNYVKWRIEKSAPYKQVEIIALLDKSSLLSQIRIHVFQRSSWDIIAPVSIKASGSLDGMKWWPMGNNSVPALSQAKGSWITVDIPHKNRSTINIVKLLLRLPKTSTRMQFLYIDEIVLQGNTAKKQSPSDIKITNNFITNGSFEISSVFDAPDFWTAWTYWPRYRSFNIINIFCDSSTAHTGKYSLCFDSTMYNRRFPADRLDIDQAFNLTTRDNSEPYTVSLFAKSTVEDARLKVGAGNKAKIFTIGTKWRKCQFVTFFPAKKSRHHLKLMPAPEDSTTKPNQFRGGIKIWVDDVQLEKGITASPYTENHLDEASLVLPETEIAIPELHIAENNNKIEVDGKLNEVFYKTLEPSITRLHYLDSSAYPSENTKTYVFYNKDFLYVCVKAETASNKLPEAKARIHDGEVYNDDAIELFIQPDSTQKRYFHFAVNSLGTVFDSMQQFGKTPMTDTTWTAPFKYNVSRSKGGWSLEAAIPLKWLRKFAETGDMKFNICRKRGTWAPVQWSYHDPRHFGIIRGLEFIKKKISINFGKATALFAPATRKSAIRVPLTSLLKEETDLILKTTIKSALKHQTCKPVSIKIPVRLTAKEEKTVEFPLPEIMSDLCLMEFTAETKGGELLGRSYQSAIFKKPAMLITNKLVFKGERISAGIEYFFERTNGLSAVLELKSFNGEILEKQRINGLNKTFAPINSDGLNPGWTSLSLTIYDDSNSLIYKTTTPVYIAEKAKSWTRINYPAKTMDVNGQTIFPYGVYFHPRDGLGYLKDHFFNICMYRVWPPFDKEKYLQFLNQAQKNGISVFIDLTVLIEKPEDVFFSIMDEIQATLKEHPAYAGIHVCDEPNCKSNKLCSEKFLRKIYKHAKRNDPLHLCFFVVGGTLSYRYAFDAEDLICYDRYTTVTGPNTRNLRDNCSVLKIAVDTARYFGKPLWRCLEGNEGAFANSIRQPTVDEWRVLVFQTLASGGNGILLWSGIPSYASLRKVYTPVHKKFHDTIPYFLNGRNAKKIELIKPSCLLWRAVDYDKKTILLIVNLDYKKVDFEFKSRQLSTMNKDVDDIKNTSFNQNILKGFLLPYEVKILTFN